MKKFFIQDDVSTAKTSSVLFFISGVIAFIQPDILVVRTLASFFGAVAIAQIVLLGPQIMEDSIPESWNTANAMIAAVILLDNLIDTGYVARELENPIAREPIFGLGWIAMVIGLGYGSYVAWSDKLASSEGVE